MKSTALILVMMNVVGSAANAQSAPKAAAVQMPDGAMAATPLLKDYIRRVDFDDIWQRPGLSPRDRSLVTIAIIVAQGRTNEMPFHFDLALRNGLTPRELSGVITQVGFYAGIPFATAAGEVAEQVYKKRGIKPEELSVSDTLLPLDKSADAERANGVNRSVGGFAPDLARYTNDFLFGDVWRRTDLTPRDRSLATIVTLATDDHVAQMTYHLARGKQNGLTAPQMQEVLIQLAFYAGWPRAFSALPAIEKAFAPAPAVGAKKP